MLKNVVVKIALVVDQVHKLVNTRGGLRSAAFHRLGAHNLTIVDDQLFIK